MGSRPPSALGRTVAARGASPGGQCWGALAPPLRRGSSSLRAWGAPAEGGPPPGLAAGWPPRSGDAGGRPGPCPEEASPGGAKGGVTQLGCRQEGGTAFCSWVTSVPTGVGREGQRAERLEGQEGKREERSAVLPRI